MQLGNDLGSICPSGVGYQYKFNQDYCYHKRWSAEIQDAGVYFSLILLTYLLMDSLSFQLLK